MIVTNFIDDEVTEISAVDLFCGAGGASAGLIAKFTKEFKVLIIARDGQELNPLATSCCQKSYPNLLANH